MLLQTRWRWTPAMQLNYSTICSSSTSSRSSAARLQYVLAPLCQAMHESALLQVKLEALHIRTGAFYLFVHAAKCQHVVRFKSIHFILPKDTQNRYRSLVAFGPAAGNPLRACSLAYPLILYLRRQQFQKCTICTSFVVGPCPAGASLAY